jgi:predicted nucleotidyltransferase
MAKRPEPVEFQARLRKGLVPKAAIRRLAAVIAERFQPDKIILFGSYAYGEPTPDSDVDLLVVMPARNEISQSVRIYQAINTPFSVDLIVRTPERLRRRLQWGDWFLREVVSRGKTLYEKAHRRVGSQGRGRYAGRDQAGRGKAAVD